MHNQNGEVYALRGNWPGIFVSFKGFPGLGSMKFDLIWKANTNVDFDLSYHDGTFSSKAVKSYLVRPPYRPEWQKKLDRLKQR